MKIGHTLLICKCTGTKKKRLLVSAKTKEKKKKQIGDKFINVSRQKSWCAIDMVGELRDWG